MICPKCFNTNDDNNNNCVYCGNVLREQVQQPVQPVAPVAPEVPVQPVTPEVPVAPVAPEVPVQPAAPVAQEPVQPQVQPQTQGFDVASMGLTAKQQAPQQQVSVPQARRTFQPQPDIIETLEEEVDDSQDDDEGDFFSSLRKRGF